MPEQWEIYRASRLPHDGIIRLPKPPPWRRFSGKPPLPAPEPMTDDADIARATTYRPRDRTVQQVNAALYLRRPLLVTGPPGTGKTSLAYAVSYELSLGPVLRWSVSSQTTLRDGLYSYDPLGRLRAAGDQTAQDPDQAEEIGRFLRLGPLGTALLPYDVPRVLLIDELDKSNLDMPNDLLSIFEEGFYEIPELVRASTRRAEVLDASGSRRVPILDGKVNCRSFPLVIMTSNGEREFPPAFLRRCITVDLGQPTKEELAEIVAAHLPDMVTRSDDIIQRFLQLRSAGELATDQLLNAIYLTNVTRAENRAALAADMMPYLSPGFPDDAEY
jgi:MoxR-like ATPase